MAHICNFENIGNASWDQTNEYPPEILSLAEAPRERDMQKQVVVDKMSPAKGYRSAKTCNVYLQACFKSST